MTTKNLVHAINESPCICTDTPETYEMTQADWHQSKVMGLAQLLLEDHDSAYDVPERVWSHLRLHLNGGK